MDIEVPAGSFYSNELLQPERKFDDDMEPEYPYVLVMDRGMQSLHTRIGAQRIAGHNSKEVARIFNGIATRVAELHEGGVVHLDLKPRNILLTPFKEVVLCDT